MYTIKAITTGLKIKIVNVLYERYIINSYSFSLLWETLRVEIISFKKCS